MTQVNPINEIFIATNPEQNQVKQLGATSIWIDRAFNPHATELVTQEGVVKALPLRKTNLDIAVGDKVYTHHFLTDDDQKVENHYRILPTSLYCKIVDNEIVAIGEWNLCEPITETKKYLEHSVTHQNKFKAILSHASQKLKQHEGKMIYFTTNSDYEIIVEGKKYFRIHDWDIIAIQENSNHN